MNLTTWKLDPIHSEVTFKVKHMMITNVSGSFKEFNVTATTQGDDFTKSDVLFTAKANSVDTNNAQRDAHLKSAEFFDAEKFPEITFKPTKYENTGGQSYKIHGDLTMKGVTKDITLDAEFGGIQKDPYGNVKAGFSVSGKLNRRDFGLNWNAALETGGVMVSEEVRVNCEIQLIRS
jgi:polyisoprenoid-binding protein YceI